MMKTFVFWACVSAALAGCSQQQIDKTQSDLASAAPKLASDGLVYAQIEAKLVQIDSDSALHVAVASHGGVVRLSGKVKTDDIEKRYVAAASQVDGVHHVDAALTVDNALPSSTKAASDFALAAAVRVAIAGQAGVNSIPLQVGVKSGVVTLAGHVPSAAVHETVVAAAKGTHGVKSVVDHLQDGS